MDQIMPRQVNRKDASSQAEARITGHFGELIQGRMGVDGPVSVLSLPCPVLTTTVRYTPGAAPLTCDAPDSAKAIAAGRAVLRALGQGPTGSLRIDRPAPVCVGAGSSTADILGTVRAVATAFGTRFDPDREADFCLQAEGASDPLMYDAPVLFASRQGRVLRRLPPLPSCRIVGIFAGPGQITTAAESNFPDMANVFDAAEHALDCGDLSALAALAQQSATANQTQNPNPAWQAMQDIGRNHGGLGTVAAHTGSAIGVILRPSQDTGSVTQVVASLGFGDPLVFDPADS